MSTPGGWTQPVQRQLPPTYPPNPCPAVARRAINPLAVASLVLGLCGLAALPVVLGHVALRQIRSRGEDGTGLAITGLVLGYLQVGLYLIVALVVFSGIWAAIVAG